MPSSRPNLTLDEQSFQGLLSAAFIIQEHNDRKKQARPASAVVEIEGTGVDEFRPGERLQRNWASMWLMSQERGLWPARSGEVPEAPSRDTSTTVPGKRSLLTQTTSVDDAEDFAPQDFAPEDFVPDDLALPASDDSLPVDSLPIRAGSDEETNADSDADVPISFLERIAAWRVKLRFRRADLYLGTAIVVAVLALLWPAVGSPQPAALTPWERALITMGIAEAPAPVIHLQGDPGIEVWVDPHSALYYCPGEEQYGKTSGGRMSSQHDAQMDRFEPAGRSACE